MTPTQLKEYENEFFKEINEIITDYGFDDTTGKTKSHKFGHRELITHRKSYESATVCLYYENVWQFIESKLKAVEGEAVDDFANALAIEMTKPSVLAGGLEGMYRLFADFVMVFSRDYLKSNKLKNKDENNSIKTIS